MIYCPKQDGVTSQTQLRPVTCPFSLTLLRRACERRPKSTKSLTEEDGGAATDFVVMARQGSALNRRGRSQCCHRRTRSGNREMVPRVERYDCRFRKQILERHKAIRASVGTSWAALSRTNAGSHKCRRRQNLRGYLSTKRSNTPENQTAPPSSPIES